jgi:hypothetical protein
MVGSEQEEQDRAASSDSQCRTLLIQAESEDDDDRCADIPECDLALPPRIATPDRPFRTEELEDSLHKECRKERDEADDEEHFRTSLHGVPLGA